MLIEMLLILAQLPGAGIQSQSRALPPLQQSWEEVRALKTKNEGGSFLETSALKGGEAHEMNFSFGISEAGTFVRKVQIKN